MHVNWGEGVEEYGEIVSSRVQYWPKQREGQYRAEYFPILLTLGMQ